MLNDSPGSRVPLSLRVCSEVTLRADWKYLRVDGHDYLFNLEGDERERANLASRGRQAGFENSTTCGSRMPLASPCGTW